MSRSALTSAALLFVGFALGMVAHTWQPVATAGISDEDYRLLGQLLQTYEQRLSAIEHRLNQPENPDTTVRGLIPLEPIATNLKSERLDRYIKLSIVLAVEDNQRDVAGRGVADVEPLIRDWLLSHLADMTVNEISGRESQLQLRQDIQAAVNDALQEAGYADFVTAALLADVSVQ